MAKRKNVGTMKSSKLRTFNSFDEFEEVMDSELKWSITQFAQDVAKDAMQEVVRHNVYEAYHPKVYQRRGENGGLLDKGYMYAHFKWEKGRYTLSMTDYAPWSDFKWGSQRSISLADAVEEGYLQKGAGPRPFYADTEWYLKDRLEEFLATVFDSI